MAGAKMGLGGGLSNLFGSDTRDLMEESLDNGTKKTALLAKKSSRIPISRGRSLIRYLWTSWQRAFACTASSHQSRCAMGEKDGYYQIIAGERRWRAARQAGLEDIPAMVLEAEEDEVMELALIGKSTAAGPEPDRRSRRL